MEGRRHPPATNFEARYRSQGRPTKPVSTVRPQSAMALTSSSSYSQMKATFPERPPTSLGVGYESCHKTSGLSRNLVYDDYNRLVPTAHQRSQSYGDGITLGEGHNNNSFLGEMSKDVNATVARRQVQQLSTDIPDRYALSPAYDRRQSQIKGEHQPSSGQTHRTQEVGHDTGQNMGRDNLAFVAEDRTHISGEMIPRSASVSFEMRSAWQRLYGNTPDMSTSSRRPSADDIISSPKTRMLEDSVRHQLTKQLSSNIPPAHAAHPQIVKHGPHELFQNMPASGHSPGYDTSQQEGYASAHYGSTSQQEGYAPAHYGSTSQQEGYAPAHYGSTSQHSQLITIRESPTGQSSSNPDHTSGSNASSQLSSHFVSNNNMSTFKPQKKKADSGLSPTIGPASKYPETQKGNRTSVQSPLGSSSQRRNSCESDNSRTGSRHNQSSPNFVSKSTSLARQRKSSSSNVAESSALDKPVPQSSSFSPSYHYSNDSLEKEYSLTAHDSLLDYHENASDSPQSHRAAARRTANTLPDNLSPRFSHKNTTSIALTESLTRTFRPSSIVEAQNRSIINDAGGATAQRSEKKLRSNLDLPAKDGLRSRYDSDGMKTNSKRTSTNYARSRSLDDLRESEIESVLSFDVENTMLTVEPSDQSELGTVYSYKGSNSVRAQLKRLEGMYTHVMSTLEDTSHGAHTRRRRWSIGSSDTSSLRHHTHQSRHSRMSIHRVSHKDVRVIDKRFQRLESHVITLARSVAHLSSELRAQNSLTREIENVKREIHELKTQSPTLPAVTGNPARGNRLLSEYDKYQGWVPSLTNPRRVNKLTKFFGQEPPLLEIFLKQLGYEKFLRNFEDEHIGMIELPYMTEERLQSIGIPMGPRLRILQEAQLHFQQGNFDVYFV